MNRYTKPIFITAMLLASASIPTYALADGHGSSDPEALVKDGKFFGEVRYRFENVEQDGFTNDATANTIRTNFGFETGSYMGFKGLIEAQIVQNIGDEDFNDTINSNTAFPIIADPDNEELNQLWLSWSGLPDSTVKVGRQKINLDNQRFVGTVNFRQNDQTFDSVVFTNNSIENLNLFYSYVGNVNRIFGDDAPLGDLDSQVHLANVSYKFADWFNLTGYGYLLEFDELATRSSETYGVRATGWAPISDNWKFIYEAEAATQSDYENNTADYDEEYYHIAPGIKGHGLTLKAGYEVLGGNGTNAFQTPLATGHKFNGWADVFLNTPDAGLEDTYLFASYKVSGTDSFFDNTKLMAIYHDFDTDSSVVGDLGDELDLLIGRDFTLPDAGQPFDKINVTLKYADYDGETVGGVDADREKFWLQVGLKF